MRPYKFFLIALFYFLFSSAEVHAMYKVRGGGYTHSQQEACQSIGEHLYGVSSGKYAVTYSAGGGPGSGGGVNLSTCTASWTGSAYSEPPYTNPPPDLDFAVVYIDQKCKPGYELELVNGAFQCQAYCGSNQSWSAAGGCSSPPVASNCQSTTPNPIDLLNSSKRRIEKIHTVKGTFPIDFIFYYNNFGNTQRDFIPSASASSTGSSASGIISSFVMTGHPSKQLMDTASPMTTAQFQTQFEFFASGLVYKKNVGSVQRYWRSSYQDYLEFQNNTYVFYRSDGQKITFNSSMYGDVDHNLQLVILPYDPMLIEKYKIVDRSKQSNYLFDSEGRLVKVDDLLSGQWHKIIYATGGNDIERIQSSTGRYLSFEYSDKAVSSAFILPIDTSPEKYLSKIIDSSGQEIEFEWDQSFYGVQRQYYLLTKIIYKDPNGEDSIRMFEYENKNFPASITKIYDGAYKNQILDKKLYAEFSYDSEGRAIYSALAGGVDAANINYISDTQLQLTNALQKKATYNFQYINGIKRISSVTGEPTLTCLRSEIRYEYDLEGNIQREDRNGQIKSYIYNSRVLEIQRIEAEGTAEEKTISTEWHPTLNLPTKITEPKRETIIQYDAQGREVSRIVNQR